MKQNVKEKTKAIMLNLFDLIGIDGKSDTKIERKAKRKNKKTTFKEKYKQFDFLDSECYKPCKSYSVQENFLNISDEEKKAVSKSIFRYAKNIESIENHINYKITYFDKLGTGTLKQKCINNISAIEVLHKLIGNEQLASKEDKKKLIKYVGWGGLAEKIFGENIQKDWMLMSKRIEAILSKEEYNSIRKSSLTAFFTPIKIINYMYKCLIRMGFTGGRILEPSCGIGHFIGSIPQELINRTKLTGIEIDKISASIAKILYPKAKIYNTRFEDAQFEDGSFDLVIGNVPFGDISICDKKYTKLKLKIHNYFIAKSLDLVREGGIVAVITSHYTMDSKNPYFREYISQKANLIAAVRLPNTAFSSSDTKVISDILFLQKNSRNNDLIKPIWIDTMLKDNVPINNYFVKNPKMILGSLKKVPNQYGTYDLIVKNKKKFEEYLFPTIKYLPKNIYDEISNTSAYLFKDDELISINDYPDIKEYSYKIIENKLYQRQGKYLIPIVLDINSQDRIVGLINLRDNLNDLIDFQLNNQNDAGLYELQNKLTKSYDNFVNKFGNVNNRENKKIFGEDPSYPLISSLEIIQNDGSIKKADIFFKRTIQNYKEITHVDTIEDALAVSFNNNLSIDFNFMSKITGVSDSDIKDQLLDKKLIFKNPVTEKFEIAEEYLSGKVVEKLQKAREYIKDSYLGEYKYNISELTRVQPIPLNYTDIDIKLGSTWVSEEYIKEFVMYILDIHNKDSNKFDVIYCNINASWEIYVDSYIPSMSNYKNTTEYGTSRKSALTLISLCLNLKEANVYDRVYDSVKEKDVSILNVKETALARQKQEEIKSLFKDWIWKDKSRRDILVSKYNKLFNSWVNRKYDGSKLQLKGISALAPKLRDYQKNAISRIIFGGNTLLNHTVGAGKTFEMVAAGMEMKRLGLCKKPLYVVPNSLVESGQFAREFMQLYPTANILVATKKDFEVNNRKRFLARISLGEWDGVIIGHSSFGMIPVSRETQEELINLEINELEFAIKDNKNRTYSKSVKNIEKFKENLEAKLKNLAENMRKDSILTFEQLGVDQLVIDEAHRFKNLFLYSKLSNIAGIPSSASQKAEDLFIKIQYIIKKNGMRKGVVFATGTPVSNSIGEMYTMQRYLMLDILKELGLNYFDSWASTFGEIVPSIEIDPTGTKYRTKLRFAKFHNVPELMGIFGIVSDNITEDMLHVEGKPVLENNKYIVREIEKCPEIEDYIDCLIERAQKISNGEVTPSEDNMLCITNDGKKVALDPRLVGIDVDYPGSKINTCVNDVFMDWKNGIFERTTHLIFCDLGTPKYTNNDNIFDVYSEIKRKLIKKGVPEHEIAFIHDANTDIKKNQLFSDFRSGKIRILIGSTSKCGEGCNIQNRLKSMYHLDCPWRPADLIQREGRILRMGNMNKEVKIYRYATKGTFDGFCWQTVETKGKFIAQIMSGDFKGREVADIDMKVMSYSEMKAACSENPLVQEKIKNDVRIQELEILKKGFEKQLYSSENQINTNKKLIKDNLTLIHNLQKDYELFNSNSNKFSIELNGSKFNEKVSAGKYIIKLFEKVDVYDKKLVGNIYGFDIHIAKSRNLRGRVCRQILLNCNATHYIEEHLISSQCLINNIEEELNNIPDLISNIKLKNNSMSQDNIGYQAILKKPFKFKRELDNLIKKQTELNLKLNLK